MGPTPQGYYRVQRGDTLAKIALNNGQSPRDVVQWNTQANSGFNPNGIEVGQLILIKPPAGYSPANPSQAMPTSNSTMVFMKPLKGAVISKFTETNKGIDISGSLGESVAAAANGTVVYSGNSLRGYGNLILIKHDNTFLTAYAYNQTLLVKEGESVVKGQKIAEVGDYAGTPKLHFEIRVNGKPVDPEPYLNGKPLTTPASAGANSSNVSTMEDFKSKCVELGFKKGTEDFGKCVLRLSK